MIKITSFLCVSLFAVACSSSVQPRAMRAEVSGCDDAHICEAANFSLYVSNQSFAIDPVDIEILIDGEPAVTGDFFVEGQHNWHKFHFELAPGEHTLTAKSVTGDVDLERTFEVTDRHWAVVDFWYYPDSHYEPTPPSLSFHIQDEPIYFQ